MYHIHCKGTTCVRSAPTFIELLVGVMITQAGFVTEAWLAINLVHGWNAYYKWLRVALGVQVAKLIITLFPQPIWFLLIDDTFIYRRSYKIIALAGRNAG